MARVHVARFLAVQRFNFSMIGLARASDTSCTMNLPPTS
jgi:hypothetical protein